MKLMSYYLFRLLVGLVALLPFSALYFLSDLLAFVLYKIVKYRRSTVEEQLRRSFPQYTEQQLQHIARLSYNNLADIMLESIKGFNLSAAELQKRYVFANPQLLEQYYAQQQSVLAVAAHYANWEWGVMAAPLWTKLIPVGIYKALSHPHIEAYTAARRSRFGMELCPTRHTSATIAANQNRRTITLMVADQNPPGMAKSYWLRFLNQDTACVIGPEKHAKTHRLPIVLIDIQRQQRGYYHVTLETLVADPTQMQAGEITAVFMQRFEQIITARPQDWLWTHRRWKKTPPPSQADNIAVFLPS